MEKRKKLKIFNDLYSYDVEICLTDHLPLSRMKDDKRIGSIFAAKRYPSGLHGYNKADGLSIIYLWHNSKTYNNTCEGTIAHEAWHAVYRMMD